MPKPCKPANPFRCFNSPPGVIRLVVMMYVQRNREKQEIDRCANNRVENSPLPLRRRERAMLRFRQMKSLQKFASIHAPFHNHFASDRHLIDQQTYKLHRSAALAEWQSLTT
jgi:putative transposase